MVVADLDEDGDLDIAALTFDSPPCLLLFNDGTGRFVDRSSTRIQAFFVTRFNGWLLDAADVDDDGDRDLVVGGINFHIVMANHVRHCASADLPRLGGVASLLLFSGPGFGSQGIGAIGVGFALAAPPLPVPGLAGRLELDPATMQIVAAVATSNVGVSSAFVPVPQDPVLFGLEVWFQGAVLPSAGLPGLTGSVHEVVLR
jgi:hypothetical protein